jgi:DNA-binding NarL/FixJ family response regulator
MTINVVIVDDQKLVRAGLRALLELDPDITVVAEAGDGAQAVHAVSSTRPDVVLMDIRMPGLDGIEATRVISCDFANVAVVVLTTFDLDEYVFAAIRAGACGFMLKDGDASDLRSAIRHAAHGDALMAPRSLRALIEEFSLTGTPDPESVARVDRLTARERDVLIRVARGRNNAELADDLSIGEATVKSHVANLLTKLECRDRAQLVVIAYESGLVKLDGRRTSLRP